MNNRPKFISCSLKTYEVLLDILRKHRVFINISDVIDVVINIEKLEQEYINKVNNIEDARKLFLEDLYESLEKAGLLSIKNINKVSENKAVELKPVAPVIINSNIQENKNKSKYKIRLSDNTLMDYDESKFGKPYEYSHQGISFIIHKGVSNNRTWTATEIETGASIVKDIKTKKECKEVVIDMIDKYGVKVFKDTISKIKNSNKIADVEVIKENKNKEEEVKEIENKEENINKKEENREEKIINNISNSTDRDKPKAVEIIDLLEFSGTAKDKVEFLRKIFGIKAWIALTEEQQEKYVQAIKKVRKLLIKKAKSIPKLQELPEAEQVRKLVNIMYANGKLKKLIKKIIKKGV